MSSKYFCNYTKNFFGNTQRYLNKTTTKIRLGAENKFEKKNLKIPKLFIAGFKNKPKMATNNFYRNRC